MLLAVSVAVRLISHALVCFVVSLDLENKTLGFLLLLSSNVALKVSVAETGIPLAAMGRSGQ